MRARSLGVLAFLTASCLSFAEEGAFMLQPDIHGDRIAFTREGDIWVADLKSGESKRLTRFEGAETRARFSPDGTQIAFNAAYDGGGSQVYIMPVEGGMPRRVTAHLNSAVLEDWTPDGSRLLCRGPGPEAVWRAFTVPAKGGPEEHIPLQKFGMGQIGANNRLAFCRFLDVSGGAWFRYFGGARNDIWVGDLNSMTFRKVFESKTQAQYPVWVGDRVFFVHEVDATWSINSVPGSGGAARRHTQASNDLIYDIQTDGKRLIYVRGNGLEVFDPATSQASPVKIRLNSDRIHMRPFKADAATLVSGASITPSGRRLLVATRGQILTVPVREGEVRLWKAVPGARLQAPVMSPNGKLVAYISDQSGEQQVWIADADGSNERQVTKDAGRQLWSVKWAPNSELLAVGDSESRIRLVKADGSEDVEVSRSIRNFGPFTHNFSPDSKWLTFVEERPWTQQQVNTVFLYDIAGKKKHAVSSGRFRDDSPTFSSDGKWIAYTSVRTVPMSSDNVFSQLNSAPAASIVLVPLAKSTASPLRPRNEEEEAAAPSAGAAPAAAPDRTVKVDLDGILARAVLVPGVSGEIGQVEVVGDRVLFSNAGAISFYDLGARRAGTLTPGASFSLSGDGRSLLVGLRVVPVSGADLPASAGTVSLQGYRLDIDPVKEWQQIYWDAWRLSRDYFYVRNMHGADWPAVGRKYAALLPQVRSRNELTELIRWMQAELSVGHSFRSEPPIFTAPLGSVPAYLGVETVPAEGFHRITRLYDGDLFQGGSPLLEPGHEVGVGTYIIAVNGRPASADLDWRELLRDRAGQVVSVTVNSRASKEGARTIFVRPHTTAVERALWERDTVKKNREYVDRISGGRVGYLYLGGMSEGDYEDFALQYFSQLDKQALIFDIRENNGGFIGATIVSILRKETYLRRSQRNSLEPGSRFYDAYEGHLTMLINEESYSDGEGGPTNWQYAKLGPVIGTNTYGALVGSAPMWPLVDGGGIQVPRYGNYREDVGWVVEGPGVKPDIYQDNDPNQYVKGVDQQLERAVKEMLDKIARNPVRRPVQPADPVRAGSKGG